MTGPRATPAPVLATEGRAVDGGFEILRVMTIQRAITQWLADLALKNHSERTIDTYDRLLQKLALRLEDVDAHEVTPAHIRGFLDAQGRKKDGTRKSAATIAQNVSILNGFFDFLKSENIITRNPTRRNEQRILSRPKQLAPDENDAVVTVSTEDVRKMIEYVDGKGTWPEKLTLYVGIYTGARRAAMNRLRVRDYDSENGTLSFFEKGSKPIIKPVPAPLETLIHEAANAGVWETRDDYLIPNPSSQRRQGERDARVIWKIVKHIADEARVDAHVHALRAAYATYYLETHQDKNSLLALQKLMGHKRIETTTVYLRRLDRRQQMETVRDLDWSGQGEIRTREPGFPSHSLSRRAPSATRAPVLGNNHFASELFDETAHDLPLETEPSFVPESLVVRVRSQRGEAVPSEGA